MEAPVISSVSFHRCQRRAKLSPWHKTTHHHWGLRFGSYAVWRESSWHQGRAGGLRSSYLEAMLNGAVTPVWHYCQTSQARVTSPGTRGCWWLLKLMMQKEKSLNDQLVFLTHAAHFCKVKNKSISHHSVRTRVSMLSVPFSSAFPVLFDLTLLSFHITSSQVSLLWSYAPP